MRGYLNRAVVVAALLGLLLMSGCGDSTEVPLAKVAPVTPAPEGPKSATRPGLQVSPDRLPGVN